MDEVRGIVLNSDRMRELRRMPFAKVVLDVQPLGPLTPRVRERFAQLDVLKLAHGEPSA